MALSFVAPPAPQQQQQQQVYPGVAGAGSYGHGQPAQLRGFDASSSPLSVSSFATDSSLGITALVAAGAAAKAVRRRQRAHRKRRAESCRLSAADAELAAPSPGASAVEVVQPYVTACSTAKKWEDAVEELSAAVGSGYEAGFAFISDIHLTMNGIGPVLQLLRDRLGVQTLVGSACGGALGQPCGLEAQVAESPAPMEVEKGPVISVGLFREAGATPFFLGGAGQGVVGFLLSEVDVHTVVCQGCRAVGPAIKVTQASGPVCQGIGGRPARESLSLIFASVDPATQAKMQENLTVGLGRVGQSELSVGDGDWLIRGVQGVTEDGGLVVGSSVQEGQPFRFHVRDRESAESDLSLMLKRYRLERAFRGGKEAPMGCLLFTCNGRGQAVYGRDNVDSRAVFEALGGSMNRVAGFFCNGEVGAPGLVIPEGDEAVDDTAVHGFTAVFAMLLPRPKA